MIVDLLFLTVGIILGLGMRMPYALQLGDDSFGEFSKLTIWRRQSWRDYRIPDSANPGTFPRPGLIHNLISKLPKKIWRPAAFLLNHGFDVAVGVWVFITFRTVAADFTSLSVMDLRMASLLAMILYLTSPLLFLPPNARLKANNSRTAGLLLGTLYFTFVLLALQNGSILGYVGATALAYLVFLTSTFAMQVVVFFAVPLALLYLHPAPLVPPALVITGGWLFPSLGLKPLLIFKIFHSQNFLRILPYSPPGTRNLFRNVLRFFQRLYHKDMRTARRLLSNGAPLLILLYSLPVLWLAVYLLVAYAIPIPLWENAWFRFAGAIVGSSAVCFLLTATGPGRIFGECERYFIYSLPMASMGITLWVYYGTSQPQAIMLLVILLQLALISVIQVLQSGDADKLLSYQAVLHDEHSKDLSQVVDFLLDQPGDVRVATVPIKLSRLLSSLTLKESGGRIKYYYRMMLSSEDLKDGMKDYLEDTATPFTFKALPSRLKEKYGIVFIVLDKAFSKPEFRSEDETQFYAALENYPTAFENDRYRVYRIDS